MNCGSGFCLFCGCGFRRLYDCPSFKKYAVFQSEILLVLSAHDRLLQLSMKSFLITHIIVINYRHDTEKVNSRKTAKIKKNSFFCKISQKKHHNSRKTAKKQKKFCFPAFSPLTPTRSSRPPESSCPGTRNRVPRPIKEQSVKEKRDKKSRFPSWKTAGSDSQK